MKEKEFLAKIQAHQGIIYKLVHVYAASEEDKKDMYQEIVLQAWKSYSSFKGEAKFSTWLYRLCLNTLLTLQRKTDRIEYTDTAKFGQQPAAESNSEDSERLYQAIRTLPETDRALISMHLDGYDNMEIGEILGITPNLVGVKLHRAKARITSLLKKI